MKSRETLSRSYNDLNTTDDNAGVRAFLHQPSFIMCAWEFKIFVFEISFNVYIIFQTVLGQIYK
jgi:hypothetical protein